MATYPKIADSEMNYFQFKAKQMLLLKKEDREWQEFCKQIAPECAACLAEKIDIKESKDIGVQANPRPPFKKLEKPSLNLRQQNEQIPEALNNIKARLENIDLALSKIYNVHDQSEKEEKHKEASVLKYAQGRKLYEEKRRCFIQNSLKTSLEKLHSFPPPKVTKKPPTIKLKNSSYFLPHDLQVKRAAARKAYLASLQTKPKVSFQNEKQTTKQNIQNIHNKKVVSKPAPISRKKIITKQVTKLSNVNKEESLIESAEVDETKDENIEYIVDAVLEDLLGEATLDLNKIKQNRREREFNTLKQKMPTNTERGADILSESSTSSPIKNTDLKIFASGDNQSIMKLKLFLDSSKQPHQNETVRTQPFTEEIMKKTSILHNKDIKQVFEENNAVKNDIDIFQPKQFSGIKDLPKFVCGVSHIITINSEMAKNILQNKERYWRYLKNISCTVKGNFNPWVLNSMLAESILDDCINDISEELSDVPSTFVQDLYNEEFIQQVKK